MTTDSKVHVAHMGPTWVLSSPGGPHIGPMNLAIRDFMLTCSIDLRLAEEQSVLPRDVDVEILSNGVFVTADFNGRGCRGCAIVGATDAESIMIQVITGWNRGVEVWQGYDEVFHVGCGDEKRWAWLSKIYCNIILVLQIQSRFMRPILIGGIYQWFCAWLQ